MANFIKIKAVDINVANQLSDVIIGGVDSVYQGLANGGASADKFTVYAGGKSYLFTVTAKGKELTLDDRSPEYKSIMNAKKNKQVKTKAVMDKSGTHYSGYSKS